VVQVGRVALGRIHSQQQFLPLLPPKHQPNRAGLWYLPAGMGSAGQDIPTPPGDSRQHYSYMGIVCGVTVIIIL